MRVGIVLLALAIGACVPSEAVADPIVITGGAVALQSVASDGGSYGFSLTGVGTSLTGETNSVGAHGFPSGSVVTVGGTVTPSPVTHAIAQLVNGTSYDAYLGGAVILVADPVMPPPLVEGATAALSTPFVATGQLLGFSTPARTGTSLFTLDVTGQGTAAFSVQNVAGSSVLPAATVFTFAQAVSPTPEPATLLLMATGLCAVAHRCRRAGKSK